jgi:hypothetical protein
MTSHTQARAPQLELPRDGPESIKEYMRVSPRFSLDERARISKVQDIQFFKSRRGHCESTRNDNTKNFFKADSSALINPMVKRNWAVDKRYSLAGDASRVNAEK